VRASGVDYAALSVGGAEAVAAWLAALGMGEYSDAFAHAAVDGKVLCSLSASDLDKEIGVSNRLHRKRLLLELQAVRAAAPPAAPAPPRRERSVPEETFRLDEVSDLLELRHVRLQLQRCGDSCDGEVPLEPVRVQSVHNPPLSYYLERTSRCLASPGAGRYLPPQGGCFYAAGEAEVASICREGFDPAGWQRGRQHLWLSAARAAAAVAAEGHSSLL